MRAYKINLLRANYQGGPMMSQRPPYAGASWKCSTASTCRSWLLRKIVAPRFVAVAEDRPARTRRVIHSSYRAKLGTIQSRSSHSASTFSNGASRSSHSASQVLAQWDHKSTFSHNACLPQLLREYLLQEPRGSFRGAAAIYKLPAGGAGELQTRSSSIGHCVLTNESMFKPLHKEVFMTQ